MQLQRFEHSTALEALSLTSVLTPLLHHYRSGLDQTIFANQIQLELKVEYFANADEAWTAVPKEGELHFFRTACKVTLQLQKLLRGWMHFHWCADPKKLEDTARTSQLLAYLACRPYYPKAKEAYTYDLLESSCIATIDRSFRTYLPDVLAQISTQLRILGNHDLADFYAPEHVNWFTSEVKRNPKILYEIFARETRIVHAWMPLLGHALQSRNLQSARDATRVALCGIFHREEDLSFLAPLFEIEATAGIDLHLERPVGRSLVLLGNPERTPILKTQPKKARLLEWPLRTELDKAA